MTSDGVSSDDQKLLQAPEERVLEYLLTTNQPHWDVLIHHPTFSEQWVVYFLRRARPVPAEAVRQIYRDASFRKNYRVLLSILRCKTSPANISLGIVHLIRWVDLYQTLKRPNLPGIVKKKIEDQFLSVLPRLGLGEKVSLARQAPKALIRHLRLLPEPPVIQALLKNYFFTYEDAVFMANFPKIPPQTLQVLANSPRWNTFKEIRHALLRNPKTPHAAIAGLARSLREHDLHILLRDPRLTSYTRRQIQNVLGRRFKSAGPKKPGQRNKKGANRP